MRVMVFGATGLVGHGVLGACLDAEDVSEVVAVGRRETGRVHGKLRELQHGDFSNFSALHDELEQTDLVLWALGRSAAGMSEADYRRLTLDFALAAAEQLAEANPAATFVFVSGAGADLGARAMWAQVKAQTEQALFATALSRVLVARPAGVLPVEGARSTDSTYQFAHAVMRPLKPLLLSLGRAWFITTREIGEALLAAARSADDRQIYENRDLVELSSPARSGR